MNDVRTVHYHETLAFDRPGKALYELAFHEAPTRKGVTMLVIAGEVEP